MQGEGKRSSMEGDGLRAEGEFSVLFDIDWNKSRTNNKDSPWR